MAKRIEDEFVTVIEDEAEIICWGCGLRLLIPPREAVFKCGWCGAITNRNSGKRECRRFWLRRLRDRSFVFVLLLFMSFLICGGVWAVYPVVFSVGYWWGFFHVGVTVVLSAGTVGSFSRAAFGKAGPPPTVRWGSYPSVGKGDLESYRFCHDCSAPKCPRTHHCRSCRQCVLDMDHHCPFIGNCVGAGNHREFIAFLIMAVASTAYVTVMSIYAGLLVWPALRGFTFGLVGSVSARGLVLVYLLISSLSVEVGLALLLCQQLCYIYEGNTYLGRLQRSDLPHRGCHNLARFFACPLSSRNKTHAK